MFRIIIGIVLAAFITQNFFFSRYDTCLLYNYEQNDEKKLGLISLAIVLLIFGGYSFSYIFPKGKLFSIMVFIFFSGELLKEVFKKKYMPEEIDDIVKISIMIAIFNVNAGTGYGYDVMSIFIGGLFYFIFCVIFGSINERLEYLEIPKFLEGGPIKLITFSLIAMVFYAFTGIKL
jgi:electron transport complex protein RnfA